MGEFQRISPGADVTALITSAQWLNSVTEHISGGPGRADALPGPRGGGRVEVRAKNLHTAEVPRGGILQLDGSLFSYAENPDAYKSGDVPLKGRPYSSARKGELVIALQPMPANATRKCLRLGAATCDVDIKNATDTTAGPIEGDVSKLEGGKSGVTILARERELITGSGTLGIQKALVQLGAGGGGGAKVALGFTTGTIPGATGTPRTPGQGTVTLLLGEASSLQWKNYSAVLIGSNVYLVGIEIGGNMIIVAAFC